MGTNPTELDGTINAAIDAALDQPKRVTEALQAATQRIKTSDRSRVTCYAEEYGRLLGCEHDLKLALFAKIVQLEYKLRKAEQRLKVTKLRAGKLLTALAHEQQAAAPRAGKPVCGTLQKQGGAARAEQEKSAAAKRFGETLCLALDIASREGYRNLSKKITKQCGLGRRLADEVATAARAADKFFREAPLNAEILAAMQEDLRSSKESPPEQRSSGLRRRAAVQPL